MSSKFEQEVKAEQNWEEKELKFDPDSSPKAWEHYKKYYEGVCFVGDPILVKKDWSRLKSNVSIGNISYEIAGDCSFNFNDKKSKLFKKIVGEDKKLNNALEEAEKKHHTLLNFDLMPVTGGLNKLKGNLKIKDNSVMVHDVGRPPKDLHDRLDTFIYFLNETLVKREKLKNEQRVNLRDIGEFFNNSIYTTSMKSENFTVLYDLLEKHNNIYEYCKVFYNIDKEEFVDRLIENGNKPITTAEDVKKYINLANDFWLIKQRYYE